MERNFCERCKQASLVITAWHSFVCTLCGIEKKCDYDISQEPRDWTRLPLTGSYSRLKRFGKLFDCVITPCPDLKDNTMLAHLDNQAPFDSIEDLLKAMKRCNCPDKRYGSCHLFTSLFVTGYVKPNPPINLRQLKNEILNTFESLEFAHRRVFDRNVPFFNYRFLLAILLTDHKLQRFLPFVKQLKQSHYLIS